MTYDGNDLEQARLWVQTNMRKGVPCPCCNQYCRVYKRKLNTTMALAMVMIYRHFKSHPRDTWLHVAAFLVAVKRDSTIAGGDVAKLRFWGLIVPMKDERSDGSDRIGRYGITPVGQQFVEGKIAVPRYVYLYNQGLLRLSEEMITIQQALGDRFSYSELMKGTVE